MRITGLSLALASTTCVTAMAAPAHADQIAFDIPAGSLKQGLDAYSRQSGRPIVYKVDEVRGARTGGFRGSVEPPRALKAILANSGFTARTGVAGSVAIVRVANSPIVRHDRAISSRSHSAPAIEDIVVTAQRRVQILQEIPVSAIAVGKRELEKAGVQKFSDLQNNTPSLSVSEGPGGRFINIRGVGLGVFTPQESAGVPIHIDGFVIPREFALDDAFLDLARVEVLRGPQGTFVGQNSTGGAVFLVTNKPDFGRLSGDVRQTFGNYGWYQTQGHVNAPISSTVAVRAAFNFERRDSFATNLGSGNSAIIGLDHSTPGNLNNQSVRVEALYQPNDDLRFLLWHSYSAQRNDGSDAQRGLPDGSIAEPRKIYRDIPTDYNLRLHRTVGQIDWDIGDNILFHSNTGYQQLSNRSVVDADGTTFYAAPGTPQSMYRNLFEQKSFNQELTLTSKGPGSFDWVIGVSYLSDIHPFIGEISIYDKLYTMPKDGGILDLHITRYSAAIFGEATNNLHSKFQLIVGGRYTRETSSLAEGTVFRPRLPTGAFGPDIDLSGNATFSAFTGRIALNWIPNDSTFVYLTASRGFKPGNVNSRTPTGVETPPLKSEFINNYEIGLKTALFDKRFNGAINVYYMDYRDYHGNIRVPGFAGAQSQNIPKARIYGIEAQLSTRLGGLSANFTGAYINSRLGHQLVIVPAEIFGPGDPLPTAPETIDLDGLPLNFAPQFTVSFNVEYEFRLGMVTLTPRIQYSYISRQFYEFYQAPVDEIRGRGLFDFRLTYADAKQWRVEGFVANLTNKTYVAGVSAGNPLTPYIGQVGYGPPRQFGVRVGYSF